MMGKSLNNIFKATRLHRTLTGLSAVLVPVSFANKINFGILLFSLCSILLYAGAGILNAKKDNDYEMPDNCYFVAGIFFLITFVLASFHTIVLIGIAVEFSLGIFYNFYSRYIFLGDVTVLSVTHHAWPTLVSCWLVGLDSITTAKLTIFMLGTFWFIIHLKNLKDTIDDKKRGYKTLTTQLKNGKKITLLFFEFSFALMFIAYFIFGFSLKYMITVLLLFLLKNIITGHIRKDNQVTALNYMRLMVIVFLVGISIEKINNIRMYIPLAIISGLYMVFLAKDMKKEIIELYGRVVS